MFDQLDFGTYKRHVHEKSVSGETCKRQQSAMATQAAQLRPASRAARYNLMSICTMHHVRFAAGDG